MLVCEPRPPELSLHLPHTRPQGYRHQQRPKCPSWLWEEIAIIEEKAKSERHNAKNKADSAKRGLRLNTRPREKKVKQRLVKGQKKNEKDKEKKETQANREKAEPQAVRGTLRAGGRAGGSARDAGAGPARVAAAAEAGKAHFAGNLLSCFWAAPPAAAARPGCLFQY